MIAKKNKPHTICEELILPAVKEVLNTVLHHKACFSVIKSIPLSNDTVQKRIDERSADVEHKLCSALRNTEFSLQLDESTMPGNESLLLGYVRFVHNGVLCEEMATAVGNAKMILLAYDPVMVFSDPISCAIPFLFTDPRESVAIR